MIRSPFELAEPGPGHPGPPHPGPPRGSEEAGLEPRWPAWFGIAALVGAIFVQAFIGLLLTVAQVDVDADSPAVNIAGTLLLDASLIIIALLLAARVMRPRLWHFGFRRTPLRSAIGWSALGMLCFYAFAAAYQALLPREVEQSTLEQLGAGDSTTALIGAGLLIVIVAPVIEETFFRGFFYRALRSRFGIGASVVMAGGLFGLIHLGTGAEAVPPIAILGMAFCLVYERTGSLYPTIALHAVNNAVALTVSPEGSAAVALPILLVVLAGCLVLPRFARAPGARLTPLRAT